VNFIINNGGTDPLGSGFMFHFETIDKVYTCREHLQTQFEGAFHLSAASRQIILNHGINIPPAIPIGNAWVVTKVLIRTTEHTFDRKFFEL